MKDIDDMRIGESFYLKWTVAVISTRTGKPCEFDEERIDINDLIITELEKIKSEIKKLAFAYDDLSPDKELVVDLDNIEEVFNEHISEPKGETE